jgi:hypothetical protein
MTRESSELNVFIGNNGSTCCAQVMAPAEEGTAQLVYWVIQGTAHLDACSDSLLVVLSDQVRLVEEDNISKGHLLHRLHTTTHNSY